MKQLIFGVFFFLSFLAIQGQSSSRTFFAENEHVLNLDLYKSLSDSAPLIVFIHGGGFVGGTKDHRIYQAFFQDLNTNELDVISIDYSKPLLGQKFDCDQSVSNKLMAFDYAARDIRRATNWILENAEDLGVSSSNIWLCGSSAGAEALLFQLFGNHDLTDEPLAADFAFTGYISLAGATTDLERITKENAIPGLLIHGSCDNLVPVGTAIHHYCSSDSPGALLLHGAESIANRYDSLGKDYQLVMHCGAGHSIANNAMKDNLHEIVTFIQSKGQQESKRIIIGNNEKCKFSGSSECHNN